MEEIKNKQIIVIVDNNEFEENLEQIKDKIKELGYIYLSNSIGYGIKIIETINEIINNEVLKQDGSEYKKPLIISNNESNSSVKKVNDIMLELLKFKTYKCTSETIYFILTKNINEALDNIIYISLDEFLNLNETTTININKELIEKLNIDKIDLSSIIPTYINLMTPKYKIKVIEDENKILLKHPLFDLSFIYINDINEINEEDKNKYDIIIETTKYSKENKINDNEILNDIYSTIKSVGLYFKE